MYLVVFTKIATVVHIVVTATFANKSNADVLVSIGVQSVDVDLLEHEKEVSIFLDM